jgi:hypothetical protein
MTTACCPHADEHAPRRACAHLIVKHDGDHLRWYTGDGTVNGVHFSRP